MTQAIKDYKKMQSFIQEVVKAIVNAFLTGFNGCKVKVARAHPQLDQSKISAVEEAPEGGEEEEEGTIEEEVARAKELVIIEEPKLEETTIEGPKELTVPFEA